MRLTWFAALPLAAFIGAASICAPPAGAAPKQRYVYVRGDDGRVYARDQNGRLYVIDENGRPRARTRVVVQPRSFLDAGTNVLPGERKFLDYAFPPGTGPQQGGPAVVTNLGNGRPGWDSWPSYNSNGPGFSGW